MRGFSRYAHPHADYFAVVLGHRYAAGYVLTFTNYLTPAMGAAGFGWH